MRLESSNTPCRQLETGRAGCLHVSAVIPSSALFEGNSYKNQLTRLDNIVDEQPEMEYTGLERMSRPTIVL